MVIPSLLTSLRRFRELDTGDRLLLLEAGLVLLATRAGLWLMPLPTVRRRLRTVVGSRRSRRPASPARIAWAIRATARIVPRATCLPQALATEASMLRHGATPDLRLGFARDKHGKIEGHAWVEDQGMIIIGGDVDVVLSRDGVRVPVS